MEVLLPRVVLRSWLVNTLAGIAVVAASATLQTSALVSLDLDPSSAFVDPLGSEPAAFVQAEL